MRNRQLRLPRHDNAKENRGLANAGPLTFLKSSSSVKPASSVLVACRVQLTASTLTHRVLVKNEVLLNVAGRQTPLFQILLVIILGLEKGLCGHDLGMNLFAEAPRFHQLFL
jgi:H+/Cl- antiporter ClcA